ADHALYGRTHPYPYAVPRPGSTVRGEIVRVEPGQLRDLDEYEGDEYRRVHATVEVDGRPVGAEVWVAVTDPPLPESERIVSGDWFDR
ncbi:MAG: gamma-glutamylcyclotransferase family protein, partial [Acidimicrobiia bacterium]|nr:gamma-glutamylcyclotransferase family protein [Acidimicrobiia bacterium]